MRVGEREGDRMDEGCMRRCDTACARVYDQCMERVRCYLNSCSSRATSPLVISNAVVVWA